MRKGVNKKGIFYVTLIYTSDGLHFLRQKTPINIIVKYVTFNVANKVIDPDIY